MKRRVLRAMLLSAGIFSAVAQVPAQDVSQPRDPSRDYPVRRADMPAADASGIRAVFTVAPGQSINAAVARCRPGDRIEVLPGTYRESVMIDLDSIELVGIVIDGDRPVLDGGNELNDAVLASGHNFVISGFTVRDYKGNGVVVNQAQNVTFRDLYIDNTGKYGIYPLACDGVLVEHCVSSRVWDAAFYAGQCRNVVIRNCEAYHNTVGIETENSVNVEISNNSAHDNSLGILVILLPNLPQKEMKNTRVIHNRVFNNNHPNTAPEGTIVHLVRPGVGMMVNAGDNTEVTRNEVFGNNSYGITLFALSDILPPESIDVDPNPDGNTIHANLLRDNGMDPAKVAEDFTRLGATGGDLFWSGKGTGNIWRETTRRAFPPSLAGANPPAPASGGN